MKIHHLKHTTLVFMGIFSILLTAFGYWYVRAAIISQAENYSIAVKEEEAYNENAANEQTYKKLFDQTVDKRAKVSTYIVSEDKIINFIESVEGIGKLTNTEISLSSINSDEMKDLSKGDYGHIKTHIDIKGSWSGVMSALTMLENLPFSIYLNKSSLYYSDNSDPSQDKKIVKAPSWNLSTDLYVLSMK